MSEETTTLIPIEERKVDFYGDEIIAALVEIGEQSQIYIPIKPICDYLGLSWAGQSERIKRDLVLKEVSKGIRVTRIPLEGKRKGGPQEALCLPLEYLNGWLFGVNALRVKEELRERVILYQRECYRILSQAYQNNVFSAEVNEQSASIKALLQIRDMSLSIARMAEQQIELEKRVESAHTRLDTAGKVVVEIQRRIGVIEKRLSPGNVITEEQSEELTSTIKALAEYLTGKEKAKNHFQGIFGELYRRFRVSTYKNLTVEQYPKVLEFLADWRKAAEQEPSVKEEKNEKSLPSAVPPEKLG